ncbi:MAG TPA: YetF domain-containing protein [Planctomycetaceae bacterium]|nr:YetF domain-containing protein [Planctomycetaceae bacterium]
MFANLAEAIQILLGGDSPGKPLGLGQVAARSCVMYAVGVFAVRLGKSRLLGRATPLDVILGFVLGSLLSRGINGSASLSGCAVAAATLVAVHWALTAVAYRYHWVGDLVKGHCHQLVSNGEILWPNMRRSHISEHDLREDMRLKANIDDVRQVQVAFKERSGEIGVVKRQAEPKVIEVGVRDGVQTVRIELS